MLFGKEAIASRPRGWTPKWFSIVVPRVALVLPYPVGILLAGVDRFDVLVGRREGVEGSIVNSVDSSLLLVGLAWSSIGEGDLEAWVFRVDIV